MKKFTTEQLTVGAILTGLLAILGPVAFPIGPVPITLQTLVVGLVASIAILPVSLSAVSLYIILGLAGLPVFANGNSGVGVLFGPTGGYIFGFVVYVLLVGLIIGKNHSLLALVFANVVAVVVQLVVGATWLAIYSQLSVMDALSKGVIPFIPLGLVKLIVVVLVSQAVLKWHHQRLLGE